MFDAAQQKTPGLLVVGVVVAFLIFGFATIRQSLKIHKLGGRTIQVPSYKILFGLDLVWETIKWGRENKNMELWQQRLKKLNAHTAEMSILGQRIILTEDPDNIKAILATQFGNYGKGAEFAEMHSDFLGQGIFSVDGLKWHDSRQLIRPQFLKDRIADLHTFERHITHMMEHIPKDGSVIEIKDLLYRFTLDSATEFLFGSSVNSLGTPQTDFAIAFAELQQFMDLVHKLGPARRFLPRNSQKKNIKILNSFIQPFVTQTLDLKPEQLKEKSEKEYNFLHALAQYTRDPQLLRDQLVAVLLAARDTTAATLSWTLYELSKQPEIVKKLRGEILETLGPNKLPNYTDLKNMKYLKNVINETLRLYPAVPFNVRTALEDTYLPSGGGKSLEEPIGVCKGTLIGYSTLAMQRREDLFGPDVAKYDPDRWNNWTPKSWQYIPFNGGPRICIGQQFALTEMGYTLVRLFQRFEGIELRLTEEQWMKSEVVASPGAGVPLSFKLAA